MAQELPVRPVPRFDIGGAERHLAAAFGQVQHIDRIADARETRAQRGGQRLALGDGGAPMRHAAREIAVVEVVGFYAEAVHQFPAKLLQHLDAVVHALQEDALVEENEAALPATRGRQFPWPG